MSMFRKHRISGDQLQEILKGLPQAKAPGDFEENLNRMIASNSHHVPNVLGSLPLVPAPDDFDARLMEAIRERRRPVAPIPVSVAAGGASINWINHIMGWIGGSLAVVAVAFFINHSSELAPEKTQPAERTQPATAQTAQSPAGAAQAPAAPRIIHGTQQTAPIAAAVAEEAAPAVEEIAPAAPHAKSESAPTVARSARRASSNAPRPGNAVVMSPRPAQSTPVTIDVRIHQPAATNNVDSATGPQAPSSESEVESTDTNNSGSMPNGVVNTGGDTGGPSVEDNRPE